MLFRSNVTWSTTRAKETCNQGVTVKEFTLRKSRWDKAACPGDGEFTQTLNLICTKSKLNKQACWKHSKISLFYECSFPFLSDSRNSRLPVTFHRFHAKASWNPYLFSSESFFFNFSDGFSVDVRGQGKYNWNTSGCLPTRTFWCFLDTY